MLSNHFRLGYYKVGSNRFTNRVDASIYSNKFNLPIDWYFNNDTFDKIDWKSPIDKSLNQLYKERALQLRQKYDHLCLFFSSGADSLNILNTFVDNNIHLDEVVIYYPKVLEKTANMKDTSGENIYSEAILVAAPLAREILKNTKTKIRIIDFADNIKYFINDEQLLDSYSNSIVAGPITLMRLAMYTTDPVWRQLNESNKTVCIITGAEKPCIDIDNTSATTRFIHTFSPTSTHQLISKYNNDVNDRIEKMHYVEFFYWTRDMPEIVVKQCQEVKYNYNCDSYFRFLLNNKSIIPEQYNNALINIIYDKKARLGRDKFVTSMIPNYIDSEFYGWMKDMFTEKEYAIKEELMKNHIKNLGLQVYKTSYKSKIIQMLKPVNGKKYTF